MNETILMYSMKWAWSHFIKTAHKLFWIENYTYQISVYLYDVFILELFIFWNCIYFEFFFFLSKVFLICVRWMNSILFIWKKMRFYFGNRKLTKKEKDTKDQFHGTISKLSVNLIRYQEQFNMSINFLYKNATINIKHISCHLVKCLQFFLK